MKSTSTFIFVSILCIHILKKSLNQQASCLTTISPRSVQNDSHCVSALPVCLCLFVRPRANWSTSAPSIRPSQGKKKKHLANTAPYLACSSNLLWAAGVKAEGLSLSGDVNPQPFQFHPTRLKALPLGRSHVLDKGAFAFHFLCDKSGERALYIVMLPHLSDISKIEVQATDRYKLKVNTKKSVRKSSYITMFGKSICSLS